LYRIAVNQCLNWQKSQARRLRLHQDLRAQDQTPVASNRGMSQQVQQALLRLHPKQRAAVVLTTCDGLSHAEAAAVLHCSETTISWRLFAARRKLRCLLKAAQLKEDKSP